MISSINNEMYYQYQNVGSYSAGNASYAFALSTDSTTTEETQEMQPPPPKPVSEEDYSSSDHMEMMRGGKQPPEMTETSTTSEVDEEMISQMGITNALTAEEFYAQYDVNEDGEISQNEMPEPGSVGIASNSTVSTLATDESAASVPTDTTEDITASSEYQQLIFKTLQAYKNHYESMFATEDGSLKKSQA